MIILDDGMIAASSRGESHLHDDDDDDDDKRRPVLYFRNVHSCSWGHPRLSLSHRFDLKSSTAYLASSTSALKRLLDCTVPDVHESHQMLNTSERDSLLGERDLARRAGLPRMNKIMIDNTSSTYKPFYLLGLLSQTSILEKDLRSE